MRSYAIGVMVASGIIGIFMLLYLLVVLFEVRDMQIRQSREIGDMGGSLKEISGFLKMSEIKVIE